MFQVALTVWFLQEAVRFAIAWRKDPVNQFYLQKVKNKQPISGMAQELLEEMGILPANFHPQVECWKSCLLFAHACIVSEVV